MRSCRCWPTGCHLGGILHRAQYSAFVVAPSRTPRRSICFEEGKLVGSLLPGLLQGVNSLCQLIFSPLACLQQLLYALHHILLPCLTCVQHFFHMLPHALFQGLLQSFPRYRLTDECSLEAFNVDLVCGSKLFVVGDPFGSLLGLLE